ncbi:hypothetical protein GGF38_003233 [Coemansia sp. RSA 25]|nr:hypothetical protein GGF38_003233 [Coemansia sp. RSA 25]
MDMEMDLISQRSAQDSGNTSSSGLTTTISSHQHALPDSFGFADSRNGHAQPVTGMFGSTPVKTSSSGTIADSEHSLGYHGPSGDTSIFLAQNNAKTSSIVAFSTGNDSYCSGTAMTAADMAVAAGSGGVMSGSHSLGQMSCAVRNLIGASVTTGAKLTDIDGSSGIFFVFPDLSIRKDGEYRFLFSFFDLKRYGKK